MADATVMSQMLSHMMRPPAVVQRPTRLAEFGSHGGLTWNDRPTAQLTGRIAGAPLPSGLT